MSDRNPSTALVFSGGGARGAYQAGIALGLAELHPPGRTRFRIMTGASAGAINAAYLAQRADSFRDGARELAEVWTGLSTAKVFRSDAWSLFVQGMRVLRSLLGGGMVAGKRQNHLLDTRPLDALIRNGIDFRRIAGHIDGGQLGALAITTTHYLTGSSVTHFATGDPVREWDKSNHISLRAELSADHVLASAAIPVFFAPIQVGGSYHGDGSVRLASPLRPAIHLGAEKILAVSVRNLPPGASVRERNLARASTISLAEIAGIMLNAVFLDSMDLDLERMERINRTLSLLSEEQLALQRDPLRPIPVKLLRPSRDLGGMATRHLDRLPRTLRYLLRGLGAKRGRPSDILSYLAFES
ncbi:MAG TPA: patatin-like phospholipase family protein, partial [Bdellovibrionota bacterium]|nr:patatin-like phospholipase family protein [Bdellovibrionota bacterium]